MDTGRTSHRLCLTDRNSGSVTGVIEVISFDLEEIVLDTVLGVLKIGGRELHVKGVNLDRGQVDFEGMTDSLVYSDSKAMKRKSMMGRLFS